MYTCGQILALGCVFVWVGGVWHPKIGPVTWNSPGSSSLREPAFPANFPMEGRTWGWRGGGGGDERSGRPSALVSPYFQGGRGLRDHESVYKDHNDFCPH